MRKEENVERLRMTAHFGHAFIRLGLFSLRFHDVDGLFSAMRVNLCFGHSATSMHYDMVF